MGRRGWDGGNHRSPGIPPIPPYQIPQAPKRYFALFIEQPRLHRVCQLYFTYIVLYWAIMLCVMLSGFFWSVFFVAIPASCSGALRIWIAKPFGWMITISFVAHYGFFIIKLLLTIIKCDFNSLKDDCGLAGSMVAVPVTPFIFNSLIHLSCNVPCFLL